MNDRRTIPLLVLISGSPGSAKRTLAAEYGAALGLARLRDELLRFTHKRGSTKFWLSTGGHNETTRALYESLRGDRKPLGGVKFWRDLV